MRLIGLRVLVLCLGVVTGFSTNSLAGLLNFRLLEDDQPLPFKTFVEGIEYLESSPSIKERLEMAPGMAQYSTGAKELTTYFIFREPSEFKNAIVRRRIDGSPESYHVRTTIICEASEEVCATVRRKFELMDGT